MTQQNKKQTIARHSSQLWKALRVPSILGAKEHLDSKIKLSIEGGPFFLRKFRGQGGGGAEEGLFSQPPTRYLSWDNLMLHLRIYFMLKPGDVLVVDAKGFVEAGPWEDILTEPSY